MPEYGEEEAGVEEFDEGVADAEGGLAGAASSAENEIGEDGYVVVPVNGGSAGVAVRSGEREVLRRWDSIDADVEKAAEECADHENEGGINGEQFGDKDLGNNVLSFLLEVKPGFIG